MANDNRKHKLGLLAASALMASTAAFAPAHANDIDMAAFPTTIEAPIVVADAGQHLDQKSDKNALRLGVLMAAGAALVGAIRIFGFKRVRKVVTQSARRAAETTTQAIGSAAKAAGRVLRSPLRMMAWVAGLSILALTGVGFYDVEWIAGLVVGGALVGVAAYNAMKLRLRPAKAKPSRRQQ